MHFAVFLDDIREFFPVSYNFAVNENEDVLAQCAPLIQHVAADAGVLGVNAVQEVGQAVAAYFRVFYPREKAPQGVSEFNSRHGG